MSEALRSASALLGVKALQAWYGESHILHGVDFEVRPGELVTLLGRNGAGKTTTLKAAMGMVSKRSGSVTAFGRETIALPPERIARLGVALCPEERGIFASLTVKENLQTGFAPVARKLQNIPDEIFELFPVLKTMMGRRGGDLSGGQQQQLAIGRALVTRPKLLVLDEPTEGIQPSIIKDIGGAIDYLRGKGDMAIVLVEQYFEFARDLADDFAVMDRGQVVIAGTRDSMVEHEVRAKLSV